MFVGEDATLHTVSNAPPYVQSGIDTREHFRALVFGYAKRNMSGHMWSEHVLRDVLTRTKGQQAYNTVASHVLRSSSSTTQGNSRHIGNPDS